MCRETAISPVTRHNFLSQKKHNNSNNNNKYRQYYLNGAKHICGIKYWKTLNITSSNRLYKLPEGRLVDLAVDWKKRSSTAHNPSAVFNNYHTTHTIVRIICIFYLKYVSCLSCGLSFKYMKILRLFFHTKTHCYRS